MCNATGKIFLYCNNTCITIPYHYRQQKLEEALLFTGMFQDALQSLFDWLETVEPNLSSETAIMGDTQTVHILMDNHKVNKLD